MDIKKKVPTNTITRDVKNLAAPTGNIYESVVILYKRANMIAAEEKKELTKKLEDFKNDRDTMDEVFEIAKEMNLSLSKLKILQAAMPDKTFIEA